jgi:peptidoglycan/LPS O-acetylase OafA/YrhL
MSMNLRTAVGLLAWLGALLIIAFQSQLPPGYQSYAWIGLVACALIFLAVVRSRAKQPSSPVAPRDVAAGLLGFLGAIVVMLFVFNVTQQNITAEWARPMGIPLSIAAGLCVGSLITWVVRRLRHRIGSPPPRAPSA